MGWSKFFGTRKGKPPTQRDKVTAIGAFIAMAVAFGLLLVFGKNTDCNVVILDVAEVCTYVPWHGMNLENERLVFYVEPAHGFKQFSNFTVTPHLYYGDDTAKVAKIVPTSARLIERGGGPYSLPTFNAYLEAGRWNAMLTVNTVSIDGNMTINNNYSTSTAFFIEPVQDYHNFLIALGTFAGFSVTGGAVIFQILYSKKQNSIAQAALDHERDSRWKDWYQGHSELLANELKTSWNKNSGIFSRHSTEGGEFAIIDEKEPDSHYSDEAKEHLKAGYPDLWKLYAESRDESKQSTDRITFKLHHFRQGIKDTIQRTSNLQARERWDDDFEPCYYEPAVFKRLLEEIQHSILRNRTPQYGRVQAVRSGERTFYEVAIGSYGIARANEEAEARTFVSTFNELYKNQMVIDAAKSYLQEVESLRENEMINRYQHRLDDITSDIEGHVPIAGPLSCRICKQMHEYIFTKFA